MDALIYPDNTYVIVMLGTRVLTVRVFLILVDQTHAIMKVTAAALARHGVENLCHLVTLIAIVLEVLQVHLFSWMLLCALTFQEIC